MWRDTRIAQTIARYAARQDTIARRARVRSVSVPSARPPDIWHASALSAIRAEQSTRRINVRISNAHTARNTVMMRSDVLNFDLGRVCQCRSMRLAPDVNVSVATETVGGRKIAHNLHRFRTPCRVHAHRPLESGPRNWCCPIDAMRRLASPSQNVRHDTLRRMRA